jgi:cytochrome c551/c552
MLWRVVFSQVDATGRIAVVGPSLRTVVTGNENDMLQAVQALKYSRLPNSDVWTRLILPTAKRLTEDQP